MPWTLQPSPGATTMRVLSKPYSPASSWLYQPASSHVLSFLSVPSRPHAVKHPNGHPEGGVPLRWRPLRRVLQLGWGMPTPQGSGYILRTMCTHAKKVWAWHCRQQKVIVDTLLCPTSTIGGHQVWFLRQRSAFTPRLDFIAGFRLLTVRRLRHITAASLWRPARDRWRAAVVPKRVRSV
jgi:hypothetical protein